MLSPGDRVNTGEPRTGTVVGYDPVGGEVKIQWDYTDDTPMWYPEQGVEKEEENETA